MSISNPPVLVANNLLLDIARGAIPGMSLMRKFGANTDVDAGIEDIWDGGGSWVGPTQARIHNIKSSDENDASGGTGARTASIAGLDSNYDDQSEIVTLNGENNVETVNTYVMIHRMIVLTAGASDMNIGNITATSQVDGTITAQISATRNQTLMAIYQVPRGKTGYLHSWYVDIFRLTVSGAVDAWLSVKPEGEVFQQKAHRAIQGGGGSAIPAKLMYLPVAAKSIIKVCAQPSTDNYKIAAGFDVVLVDN